MEASTISISGQAAVECVRALAAGLSSEERVKFLAESLPLEARQAAFKELLLEVGLITAEEAGSIVKWTASGFLRVATKENCPVVKLGHKQPPLFRLIDVYEMFKRMRIWPKGRPVPLAFHHSEQAA